MAVVLIDASAGLTEQDVRVLQQAIDAGRALVIAFNKWDLTDEDFAAIDERLNEKGYIMPGLGDAGDRIFGTRIG